MKADANAKEAIKTEVAGKPKNLWLTWIGIALMVYLIILAVGVIGSGFKWASGGAEGAKQIFSFATNPFMGLMMGILATSLVQSSSTVTSIIVGLVAGGLPVPIAIPMIMGANIGTTITNTLVSLGHVRHKEEFKNAFQAATIHDFFNLLCVIVFLPLEMIFGFLERVSGFFATLLYGGTSMSLGGFNFIKAITKPVINLMGQKGLAGMLPDKIGAILLIFMGIIIIFTAIFFLSKLLKKALSGKAKAFFHNALGRGPISGITSGTIVTILVQSSSTTTSLAVPLAGTGILSLKEIYPFTLGANIGTCITALLASTAVTGDLAQFALQIALVHLFYNTLGVVVIYGIPIIRNIPLKLAENLATIAAERKIYAAVYLFSVFFIVPLILMGLHSVFQNP